MSGAFDTAAEELKYVCNRIDPAQFDTALKTIAGAETVVLYGCGREALQLRGLAMRLYHLGLAATYQGVMSTPPLGRGDLLIASAGPGELATVTALMKRARSAGAAVLFLTAEADTHSAEFADHLLVIPAQTMASDQGDTASSTLPMGSLYEGALFLLFEILVLELQAHLGIRPEDMRARHTNLE